MAKAAVDAKMASLEQDLQQLESMIDEVDGVSTVLDIRPGVLSTKATFATQDSGAALLAHEISEDLQRWRAAREDAFVRFSRETAKQLKQAVVTRREVDRFRAAVREEVRNGLFDAADLKMREMIDELHMTTFAASVNIKKGGHAFHQIVKHTAARNAEESVGRGPCTIAALKKRLEVVIAPVETLRPGPPKEMAAAVDAVNAALERKRLRVQMQSTNLPVMASGLDAELLSTAQRSMQARREAMQDQLELQVEAIRSVREAQDARSEAFEELAQVRCSGPMLLPPRRYLDALAPSGNQLSDLPAPRPEESVSDVKDYITEQGIQRVRALAHEFKRKHLTVERPHPQAEIAQTDIDIWKLQSAQELLDRLRTRVSLSNRRCVDGMRELLRPGDEKRQFGLLAPSTATSDDYLRHRSRILTDVGVQVENAIQEFCERDQKNFSSWRRRGELCALKRSHDIEKGIDAAGARTRTAALVRLGELAQKMVNDCHVALPLRREEFRTTRKTAAFNETLGPKRIAFVEKVVNSLPDTVESCAVTKAALCLIDEELQRLVKKLKEAKATGNAQVGSPRRVEGPVGR